VAYQDPAAPRILAVRFGAIGDIVLITPLLRALRERHRECYLAVVTKREYAPLLSDNPHLDRVIAYDRGTRLTELAAELRADRFSHHLDLHDNLRSRALRWLVPGRWTGYPRYRLARTLLIRTKRDIYPDNTPPIPERFFAAARELDVQPDGEPAELHINSEERHQADLWLEQRSLGQDRPLVVVAPMAAHATKRWPVGHWTTLVQLVVEAGADVVVVGGPGDVQTCESVARVGGDRAANTAGVMKLQGTGAILQRAKVTIAGDTGVMHMSTAVRTPVVALFGPTVEPFGFFPYCAENTVLQRKMPCRPCSKMGGPSCPLGHHLCMKDISPDDVAVALERWL
jgi:lipopolysaccharide heptosyltransferase II